MANRSTMAFAQAVAVDLDAPAPGTVSLEQDPVTRQMVATITRPTVDVNGEAETDLKTEYRMASRDLAFVQAVNDQNFEEASRLATINVPVALTAADAGSTDKWSYPPGATGAHYVAVAWADNAGAVE